MPESSRRSTPTLSRALDLTRHALGAEPAGLLTDFDGTLSPIVEEPDLAILAGGAASALASLARRLAVVAIVTGRAALDARRLVGVDGLLVVGNHGTEWLDPGAATPHEPPAGQAARQALRSVLDRIPAIPGAVVEDKGLSATVHVRSARDPVSALEDVRAAIGDSGPAVDLRPGRMSLELRPVGLGDKGVAVRAIVERHGLRGVVVMGDDVTDLDMFTAVAELRAAGRLRGAIVAVGGAGREVPPSVAEAADVTLESPESVALLLEGLVRG